MVSLLALSVLATATAKHLLHTNGWQGPKIALFPILAGDITFISPIPFISLYLSFSFFAFLEKQTLL